MSGYTQLTREQRYQIQALMKTGQNQTQMATVLGVHKATISRELRRNRGLRGYRPHQAHQRAQARQAAKPRTRLSPHVWQQVETLVRQAWSPEQIQGRFQLFFLNIEIAEQHQVPGIARDDFDLLLDTLDCARPVLLAEVYLHQ